MFALRARRCGVCGGEFVLDHFFEHSAASRIAGFGQQRPVARCRALKGFPLLKAAFGHAPLQRKSYTGIGAQGTLASTYG